MKGILVIRPGAIGDALLTFPVLKALKEYHAGRHVILVSNAQVLQLALAFGVAEQAFDFQDIRWSELFSTAGIHSSSMRALIEQTDLAICWMRDPDGIIEHNLKMSGVKHRILAPGRPSEGERIHIVDYLAQTVGLTGVISQFTASSSIETETFASKDPVDQMIAIHPGSGAAIKCWPTYRFATVIKRLWEQNRRILLLAGPADSERLDDLMQQIPPLPTEEMLLQLTNAPLLEVARCLQQCRCFLGNDSGITHLAALLNVPTVAIFGPTDPLIWRPVGQFVNVLQGHTLEDVSVETVIGAII